MKNMLSVSAVPAGPSLRSCLLAAAVCSASRPSPHRLLTVSIHAVSSLSTSVFVAEPRPAALRACTQSTWAGCHGTGHFFPVSVHVEDHFRVKEAETKQLEREQGASTIGNSQYRHAMSNQIGKAGLGFARVWHHVDLSNEQRTLGRLASQIAIALIGKHKPITHITEDAGDYVVVSNCQYLKVTGKKISDKTYWSHTTRPGSGMATPMDKIIRDYGYGEVLRRAVSRMLPKNRYRKERLARLKVFDGAQHPYQQNIIAWADEYPQVEKALEESITREKQLQEFNKLLQEKKL